MRGVSYTDESLGADFELVEIPDGYAEQAHKAREEMVETVAETDDELLEKYLSGEEITNDELRAAIRRATIANRLQPVLCGSAFKNKGVQPSLGCRDRVSAVAVGHSGYRRHRSQTTVSR